MDLRNYSKAVFVFTLDGCSHCHEYMPRLLQVASRYRASVPTLILDANSPKNQAVADRFQVTMTPTTVLAQKLPRRGQWKLEGAVSEQELIQLYELGARI